MYLIGLTGGIGSGKTFISKIICSNYQFKLFDSDLIAKNILNFNKKTINIVKKKFGIESYIDNRLNTKYISNIVFSDLKKLKILNEIVHPEVSKEFEKFKIKNSKNIIVIESALLFESGVYLKNNINILVVTPINLRIDRIINRDKISKKDTIKIINSQWKDSKKIDLADFVIENINRLETEKIVKKLMNDILLKYEKN